MKMKFFLLLPAIICGADIEFLKDDVRGNDNNQRLEKLSVCYGRGWWKNIEEDLSESQIKALTNRCNAAANNLIPGMKDYPGYCRDYNCLAEKMIEVVADGHITPLKPLTEIKEWKAGEGLLGPEYWEVLHPFTRRYHVPEIAVMAGEELLFPPTYPSTPPCLDVACIHDLMRVIIPKNDDFINEAFPIFDGWSFCYGKNWYKEIPRHVIISYADDIQRMCSFVVGMDFASDPQWTFHEVSQQEFHCKTIECLFSLPFYSWIGQ